MPRAGTELTSRPERCGGLSLQSLLLPRQAVYDHHGEEQCDCEDGYGVEMRDLLAASAVRSAAWSATERRRTAFESART